MTATEQWLPVPFIDRGINRAMAADQIDMRETPQCANVDFEAGQSYTRDGFRYIGDSGGQAPNDWPLDGAKVLYCDTVGFLDGTSHTVAITDTKFYIFVAASNHWSALVTFAAYSGGPVSIGSTVPLVMGAGNYPMTYDKFLDEEGEETYVFANDGHVICYNSAGEVYHLSGATGYRGFVGPLSTASKTVERYHRAAFVATYDFRLFLGVPEMQDVTTSTALERKRMRLQYSGVGNLVSWTSTDYINVIGDPRQLTGAKPLKDTLVAYKPASIHTIRRTGSGETPYRHDMMVEGVGAAWGTAVVNTPYGHMFFAADGGNIRVYTGGFDAPSISPKLFTPYDSLDKMESGDRLDIVSAIDLKWEKVYFAIPVYDTTGGAVFNRIIIIYDYRNKNWTRYRVKGADTLGWSPHAQSIAWQDLEGTWAGQRWRWRDMYSTETKLLIADSDKYTSRQSIFYASDESTDYGAYLRSRQIRPPGAPPDQRFTFHEVQFRSNGPGFLRASTDMEEDFVSGDFTSSDNDGRNSVPLGGKQGHWLQLQWERTVDSGDHFEIRDIAVLLQPEATRGTTDYE